MRALIEQIVIDVGRLVQHHLFAACLNLLQSAFAATA